MKFVILIGIFLILLMVMSYSTQVILAPNHVDQRGTNATLTELTFSITAENPIGGGWANSTCYTDLNTSNDVRCLNPDGSASLDSAFIINFTMPSNARTDEVFLQAEFLTSGTSDNLSIAAYNWTLAGWRMLNVTINSGSDLILRYNITGQANVESYVDSNGLLRFMVYANGTAAGDISVDSINATVQYTNVGKLNVTLILPSSSPLGVVQNATFNVSANITCSSAGICGNVNGTIFYNTSVVSSSSWNRSLESVDSHQGEENILTGAIVITSTDLEMTYDTPTLNQTGGMLFTKINIPQGSTITKAYINFTASVSTSATTDLRFHGEAIDNAPVIDATDTRNISDRQNTTASVDWDSIPAWTAATVYNSTDISSIIQEIVGRPGWAINNSLFIKVSNHTTNTGPRTAWDHNGGTAPKLYIEYQTGVTNYPNIELNGTVGDKPFYNFTTPVNFSCGSMAASSQCYASWLVNATGPINSNWLMNVTAKSDERTVIANSTQPNFQINITDVPPATGAFCGGNYNGGNWVVTGKINCFNELIPLSGNLTINQLASLNYSNITFFINTSLNNTYNIYNNGNFSVRWSNFSTNTSAYGYLFKVNQSAKLFHFNDSFLQHAGNGSFSIEGGRGLELYNNGSLIKNSTFDSNTIHITLYGANRTEITYSILRNATHRAILANVLIERFALEHSFIYNNTNTGRVTFASEGLNHSRINNNTFVNSGELELGATSAFDGKNNITWNNFTNSPSSVDGIFISKMNNNRIQHNYFYNVDDGIFFSLSGENNLIDNNTIYFSRNNGLYLLGSVSPGFAGNNITNNRIFSSAASGINESGLTRANNFTLNNISNSSIQNVIWSNTDGGAYYYNRIFSSPTCIKAIVTAYNYTFAYNTVFNCTDGIVLTTNIGAGGSNLWHDNVFQNFTRNALTMSANTRQQVFENNSWKNMSVWLNLSGNPILPNNFTNELVNNATVWGMFINNSLTNEVFMTRVYINFSAAGAENNVYNSTLIFANSTVNRVNGASLGVADFNITGPSPLAGGSFVMLINATLNKSEVYVDNPSKAIFQWYLNTSLRDELNNPTSGSLVWLNTSNDTLISVSNIQSYVDNMTEFIRVSTNDYYHTNYTVLANNSITLQWSFPLNFTTNNNSIIWLGKNFSINETRTDNQSGSPDWFISYTDILAYLQGNVTIILGNNTVAETFNYTHTELGQSTPIPIIYFDYAAAKQNFTGSFADCSLCVDNSKQIVQPRFSTTVETCLETNSTGEETVNITFRDCNGLVAIDYYAKNVTINFDHGTLPSWSNVNLSLDNNSGLGFKIVSNGTNNTNIIRVGTVGQDTFGDRTDDWVAYRILYTPPTILQFSVKLVDASAYNISNTIFPGNSTEDIWFNATNTISKFVEPCVGTTSPPSTRCQVAKTNKPIIIIKNTGTVSFNVSIRLDTALPSYLTTWANFSNTTVMSSCSGWTLGSNLTILSTSAYNFTKAMCPNNETAVWLWTNFTDAPQGIQSNYLNYTSQN